MKNLSYHFEKRYYIAIFIFSFLLLIFTSTQYFLFKNSAQKKPEVQFFSSLENDLTILNIQPFNPNDYSENDWKKLGFTEKQVQTILKYKDILGGSFSSKSQLKKCYAISEEKYKQIEPYINLPETFNDYNSKKVAFTTQLKISHKFNPDDYSIHDWIRIGFSEKQAAGIMKYKNYLGGSFQSKEKFRECYFISPENFQKMTSFILLPEKSVLQNINKKSTQTTKNLSYFNPNQLDVFGWMKLGFTDKQANVIVNYRDKNLKGSFKNFEDVKKCFVISEEKFMELKPYIKFDSQNVSLANIAQQETDYSKIDLNKITYKQLLEYGFDEKAAGSFVGFRKKLGGFANVQQILDTYNIDKELTQKLINTAILNTENITKYSLLEAPEDWLKTHPYFKYSADKIIFYRISNSDENKIWKLLKLKPEYEAKMRWYLK